MARRSGIIVIHQAVRYALMIATAAVTTGYTLTASAANANTTAKLGKVTVTGTRIKRTNIETAQPITRIGRQQIKKSGYTNIGQLLGRLSFAGAHINSVNSYSSNVATRVNLRGLGSNRTLVLVNGKRWIEALGGITNLNTIPTSIVDHIEVLQDGASAVYGSDAIAGVVNIITIKNFRGAEAHAYYGIRNDPETSSWDGQIKQYDFTVGSGNDRGNVVFSTTYREENRLLQSDRKLTRTPIAGEPPTVGGVPDNFLGHYQLFGSAVSGKTFGKGTCGTYNPGNPTNILCDLTLQNAPAQPSLQNFRNFTSADRYNPQHFAYLQKPSKDVTVYVQGHYDLFDNVTFSASAAYNRNDGMARVSPPVLNAGATLPKTVNGQHIGIAATNPYNPFGVDLVADPSDPCIAAGSCIGLSAERRKTMQQGPALGDYNNDNFHIFAGFNGYVNLFDREIDWDFGFAQSRKQNVNIRFGRANLAHEARALGPLSQCTSPCVPLNLFGGAVEGGADSITQVQANYLKEETHNIHQANLRDWTANLSSDVYDLPAGPLGVAIGYERIDNYGYFHPDALIVEGLDADRTNTSTSGRIVRDAEYAELNIPLLADLPGAKSLSVDIANRWTQFKRSGSVGGQSINTFIHNSSGRLNIRWQVINDLLLRASWSQGFRSPTFSSLFGGIRRVNAGFTDPCAGGRFGGYVGGPLPPNCPNGTADVQPNNAVLSSSGSNSNLKPESSLSRTAGFVYSPSQVPGLDINADYFKIELTNAISYVGFQNIVSGCFENSSFCNLLTVQGNQVTDIFNYLTNTGDLLTEGIDVGLHYKFPSTPVGDFDARINGTFLKTYDTTTTNRATKTGFATSHLAGANPYPKRRFNGYLDWDYGNWSAQYRIEYLSDTVDTCSVAAVENYCSYPNRTTDFQGASRELPLGRQHMGSTVYHDVHVAYTIPSINTTVGLGVRNLFDKKPPINGGGNFNFGLYRLPSRLVYGSIRVRF